MRTGINDNMLIHSFSGGIHCKHHLQNCLAKLQANPKTNTEEKKRIIYRTIVQYVIFTVLTYYSIKNF